MSTTMNTIDYSIYIPRINVNYGKTEIQQAMYYVGFVKDVDFATIHPASGFINKEVGNIRSAFVHLRLDCLNAYAREMIRYLDAGEPFKFWVNDSEYWLLLKNHNPISRTWMNIHQVVDNCKILEQTVADCVKEKELQDKKIAGMEEEITKLRAMVTDVVCLRKA